MVGLPGQDGLPGLAGMKGRPGLPGYGFPGPEGFKGERGDNGPPGRSGLSGKKGENGRNGIPGAKGAKVIYYTAAVPEITDDIPLPKIEINKILSPEIHKRRSCTRIADSGSMDGASWPSILFCVHPRGWIRLRQVEV